MYSLRPQCELWPCGQQVIWGMHVVNSEPSFESELPKDFGSESKGFYRVPRGFVGLLRLLEFTSLVEGQNVVEHNMAEKFCGQLWFAEHGFRRGLGRADVRWGQRVRTYRGELLPLTETSRRGSERLSWPLRPIEPGTERLWFPAARPAQHARDYGRLYTWAPLWLERRTQGSPEVAAGSSTPLPS